MKKERRLQSKTFRRYLFSYMSIVLIALSVLSVLELQRVAENMKQEEIRVTEAKLKLIVEDLENQIEEVRTVVIEIAGSQIFRSDYFCVEKYREILLLEQLHRYRRNSDIGSEYFMSYASNKTIYTSDGTVTLLPLYLSEWLDEAESVRFAELLSELYVNSPESLVFYQGEGCVFFIYPLEKYAYEKKGRDGVICFAVTEEILQECVEKFLGETNGKCAITYRGATLLNQEVTGDALQLQVISDKGDFAIRFYPDEAEYFNWENVFSVKDLLQLAGVVLFVILMAFVVAYWNFLPMRKIVDKYKHVVGDKLSPDWMSVDMLFETLLKGKEKDHELLREQFQVLKEQTIRIIALGGYSDRVQEYLMLLNIRLPGPVYGIIKCNFNEEICAQTIEELNQSIEGLSGEGLMFYAYYDKALNVMVSAEEEYQMEEAAEMLQALFESLNFEGNVEIACISREIEKLCTKVQKQKKIEKKQEKLEEPEPEIQKEQSTIGWNALKYIREHCTDYDLSLNRVAEEFKLLRLICVMSSKRRPV